MKPGYVTAFLGNRDNFQVPQALAEQGMLAEFVTGLYRTPSSAALARFLPAAFSQHLDKRFCADIPPDLVVSRPALDVLLRLSSWARDPSLRSWNWANKAVSKAARDSASRHAADLLLYEPYAWEAFTAEYKHRPHKVLFHFHPHPLFERKIIEDDARKFAPMNGGIWQRTDAWPEWDARVVDTWKHADLVLCASSFTRSSLIAQGLPEDRCRVVPYGIELPRERVVQKGPDAFSVLCVGSGIQRKGMHHLLKAWSQATLPAGAKLTLVCRHLDACLEPLIAGMPESVTLFRGVSKQDLQHLFQTSSLFALPSLVEGFGQVFLEALSFGCPVLGTPHTCLPDLGDESQGVFTVPAGNVEALKTRLEQLADQLTSAHAMALRHQAMALASTFTWPRFRKSVVESLER